MLCNLPCLRIYYNASIVHAVFTIRMMNFDLEIFGTLLNGSCHPMSEGNVVFSYRIGTNRQWKIIEEYPSLGKPIKL